MDYVSHTPTYLHSNSGMLAKPDVTITADFALHMRNHLAKPAVFKMTAKRSHLGVFHWKWPQR